MAYEIYPLKGAGQFEFGMNREDIRIKMNSSFQQVDEDIDNSSFDMYMDEGIIFHYSSDLHLEAIDIFRPERAILHDCDLLNLTRGEAKALLTKIDPETRIVADDAKSYNLGLWTVTEDPDDLGDAATIENVIVAVPDFFGDPDQDFSKMDVWELADGLGEVAQEFVREYFGERPDPKADPQPE